MTENSEAKDKKQPTSLYMLDFLKFFESKLKFPKIVTSILLWGILLLANWLTARIANVDILVGHYFHLTWVLIGPLLYFFAEKFMGELWDLLEQKIDREKYLEYRKFEVHFYRKWHFLISLIYFGAAIGVAYYQYFPVELQGATEIAAFSIWFTVYMLTWLLLTFCAGFGIKCMILFMILIWRLSRTEYSMNPVYESDFSFIRELGNIYLKAVLMECTGAFVIPLAIQYTLYFEGFLPSMMAVLGLIVYPLFVFLAFFVPLWPLHRLSKRAKTNWLAEACSEYEKNLDKLANAKNQEEKTDALMETLVCQNRINNLRTIPVWPWNAPNILKLIFGLIFLELIPLLSLFISGDLGKVLDLFAGFLGLT
ncbi:MAG: hypothetical protein ACTSSH_00920, partial [Candidatus Heimdallarchaeota archaeon]